MRMSTMMRLMMSAPRASPSISVRPSGPSSQSSIGRNRSTSHMVLASSQFLSPVTSIRTHHLQAVDQDSGPGSLSGLFHGPKGVSHLPHLILGVGSVEGNPDANVSNDHYASSL